MKNYVANSLVFAAVLLEFSLPARAATISAGGIEIIVDGSGAYQIRRQAQIFQGRVPAAPATVDRGTDALGSFQEIRFASYAIKLYGNRQSVLFHARGGAGAAGSIRFPSFSSFPNTAERLSYRRENFSPVSFDLAGDAPWVFYGAENGAFVLSPASHFMIANNFLQAGTLSVGIEPQVTDPANGVVFTAILSFGAGVNAAYENWGRALTDLAGKARPASDADPVLARLGYWTDNRSSYWYNDVKGLGYAGTLLAIRDEFAAEGLPLGHLQLDSWWYLKGSNPPDWRRTSYQHGIYLYEAAPELFLEGLAKFQADLGLPLVTHSRWIDPTSPYVAQYRMSAGVSIDPAYWDRVMSYLAASGVETYEQDWLNEKALPRLDRLKDGDLFMDGMADAASRHGVSLQYCMPLPRHFLQGSKYSNLHSIRPSGDGFERSKWTQFLFGSRLASSLGIWPWVDVFFSQDRENILLATLSGGIVGVGDRLGSDADPAGDLSPEWCAKDLRCRGINADNLHRAVRADGVVVKPDTAIVPLDASYSQRGSVVSAAYTHYARSKRVDAAYVFAYADSAFSYELHPSDFGISGSAYVYRYFDGAGSAVAPGGAVTVPIAASGSYFVVVPASSEWALLGDVNLFVPLGKKRVEVSENGDYAVKFAPLESEVSLTVYDVRSAGLLRKIVVRKPPDAAGQAFIVRGHIGD